MSRVCAVSTCLPEFTYNQSEVKDVVRHWLVKEPERLALLERFLSSSNTQKRHFALPAEQVIQLSGLAERASLFETHAPALGAKAVISALAEADLLAESIQSYIFTSCSCPTIPSIDALILELSDLPRNVKRIPIYQHGCAGGVTGLSIANQLASSGQKVLLNSVELCSLVFQKDSPSTAQLVGASIFADGAAAVVLDNSENGLQIVKCESYLIPNSRQLMGYDTFDDGFHLRLERELPGRLAAIAPVHVDNFLKENNLERSDIAYWLFHPGGVKILDALENNLGLTSEQCHWARDLLTDTGNLSSASVLFVLKRFLNSNVMKSGDNILMLGVGPGLTLELILFKNCD